MNKTDMLKCIRAKCLDCCCDSAYEVGKCSAKDCPIWELRYGKDPTPARTFTGRRPSVQTAGGDTNATE